MSRVTAEERGRRQTAFVGRGEKRTARGATEQNRFGRSQETGETEARTPGERTGGRDRVAAWRGRAGRGPCCAPVTAEMIVAKPPGERTREPGTGVELGKSERRVGLG